MRILPDNYVQAPPPSIRARETDANKPLAISGASLNVDFFSFSRTGLALGNLSAQNDMSIWNSRVTGTGDDESLQLMDKSIAEVGGILEQMQNLSKLAEDEELTDLDRIDLQIDMQRLQNKLAVATRNMSLSMEGGDASSVSNMDDFIHNNGIDRLLRAKERILNGEKWDAAEIYEAQYTVSEIKTQTAAANGLTKFISDTSAAVPDGDTATMTDNGNAGKFELAIDELKAVILAPVSTGGEHKVTDDPNIPTLKTLLRQDNAIILMDAESAKEGTKKLEAELESLLALKNELREVSREEPAGGKLFAEKVTTESDIQEMLGQLSQEKQKKSEELQQERDREATGGRVSENSADVNPSQEDETSSGSSKNKPIKTSVGTMKYDEEAGLYRLVSPEGKKGRMFSKLERFFLDGIGKRCATPLGGKLQNPTIAPTAIKIV